MIRKLLLLTLCLATLVATPAFGQGGVAPTVVTGNADVNKTAALIHGTVDPNGEPTQYWVEFGVSGFGQRSAKFSLQGFSDPTDVQVILTNLNPGKTWVYRVVAQNADGTTQGAGKTFVTPVAPATATTKDAGAITQTGATLTATVNNSNAASSVSFEYGPTTAYGASTPATPVGPALTDQNVSGAVTGLTADTTYHYRVVQQVNGTTQRGGDRTFQTTKIPNGVLLQASAPFAAYSGSVDLSGVLVGSENAGKAIHIQADTWPFGGSWAEVAAGQTDGTGAFKITVTPLLGNTMFRAVADTNPQVISQNVTVSVPLQVTVNVSAQRVSKGDRVRFFGQIAPSQSGAQVLIQAQRGRRWVTVGRARSGGSAFSTKVRIRSTGSYRAMVQPADGGHLPGASSSRYIRVGR